MVGRTRWKEIYNARVLPERSSIHSSDRRKINVTVEIKEDDTNTTNVTHTKKLSQRLTMGRNGKTSKQDVTTNAILRI